MDEVVEFPYLIDLGRIVMWTIVSAIISYYMTCTALENTQPLNYHSIILNMQVTQTLFWSSAIGFGCASIIGVYGVIAFFTSDGILRLTETSLQMPYGLLLKTQEFKFKDISGTRRIQIRDIQFLEMFCKNKKISINQNYLPDSEAFEKVCDIINSRLRTGSIR